MTTENTTPNVAVFCDFENVAIGVRDARYDAFDIDLVLARILDKGKIVFKKAYADWDRFKSAKRSMHEASFELVEIPHVSYSGKNSADIRLVVDALDLSYTKFYDGAIFHRVIPGFMIQGGDPDKNGLGKGPRTLDLEPSDKLHVPGVLSMARLGNDKNSASCQFFIMHGTAPALNGEYSAFGKLVNGSEVVDSIATTRLREARPVKDQIIERAIVLNRAAPADKDNEDK